MDLRPPGGQPDNYRIQLTDAQMRKLKRLAAERGVSRAALIREGVDLLVRGTPTDLAIEHDRYLSDAFSR